MTKILPILALLLLTACASLETNAYRVIGTTATAVDTGMKAWAEQVVRKNIPASQQTDVRNAYRQYQQSMLIASNSIAIYRVTSDKNQVGVALNSLSFISGSLLSLLQPIAPPDVRTNLPPEVIWNK